MALSKPLGWNSLYMTLRRKGKNLRGQDSYGKIQVYSESFMSFI